MSLESTLQTRIDILQGQVDRAIESGATENLLGYPMDKQIEDWNREIAKAKRQIKKLAEI